MKKRAVLVIAEKDFRDEEYLHPKRILEEAGVEVATASTTTNQVSGKLGAQVNPDLLVSQIQPEEFDCLVFVGGGGSEQYFDDLAVHALAKDFLEKGKVLAAICIAPVVLARAGLLSGKRATVYIDGAEELKKSGAVYTGKAVETDGRVITGNGPQAARDFGRELVRVLTECCGEGCK